MKGSVQRERLVNYAMDHGDYPRRRRCCDPDDRVASDGYSGPRMGRKHDVGYHYRDLRNGRYSRSSQHVWRRRTRPESVTEHVMTVVLLALLFVGVFFAVAVAAYRISKMD